MTMGDSHTSGRLFGGLADYVHPAPGSGAVAADALKRAVEEADAAVNRPRWWDRALSDAEVGAIFKEKL